MAWITYEPNRIVHVPSDNELIMRSYKIAWNSDDLQGCTIIRDGDRVYDLENADEFRQLKENVWGYGVVSKTNPQYHHSIRRRHILVIGNEETRQRFTASNLEYDNVAIYYVIMLYSYYRSNNRLLFVSTDMQKFEKAKQALQYGLGAIRLDELNGMPSGCDGDIFKLLNGEF